MKNIKFIAITIFVLTTQMLIAQDFEIPQNIKLEQESDYIKYEKDVLKAINWLENTSVEEHVTKREHTRVFVMKWIMDTPTITIGLQAFQIDLTEKNPELLTSFLGGWTKFAIENPSEKEDVIKSNIAGFKSLMKVYSANKGKGIKKDNKVEKLIKLSPEELNAWVRKEIE
ncbi:hypothetical protein [uncultured Formosa sp.]|uniref:hypothetical protein n=1 Tax=uncultured Formosa sp. TaxID=255435 RepID=UPI00260EAE46|nr:hypothetical protein [uncultured Formosa sp.]